MGNGIHPYPQNLDIVKWKTFFIDSVEKTQVFIFCLK